MAGSLDVIEHYFRKNYPTQFNKTWKYSAWERLRFGLYENKIGFAFSNGCFCTCLSLVIADEGKNLI